MSHKKQIFKLNILKKLLTDENSCVFLVPSTRLLALPPFFLNNMKSGILYMLNNMLKKYDRSLGGIVIGYQNIKVLMDENTWIIPIGTSETEIKVNVEFYIFQPKIGSYLEGAVNKKSNNHIGCLVHHYFNATILKPEDVDYENWSCKDLNVDDIIIFRVKDLDFTSLLPYIEGIVDDNLLNKIRSKISGHCDIDSTIKKVANKSCQDKISFSEEFEMNGASLDKKFDVILENKEVRSKNEEICALKYNLHRNLKEVDTSLDSKKKKNKNAKKELSISSISISAAGKEKSSNEQKKNSSIFNEKSKLNEWYLNKEKKNKKKKKKIHDVDNSDVLENSIAVNSITEESNLEDISCNILENCLQVKNENLNSFVKFFKNIKKEKKKKDKETFLNSTKSIQCLSSKEVEDNVLYSTMIEPVSSKKMKISYCSPIPRSVSSEVRNDEESPVQDLDSSIFLSSRGESDGKEKEKKRHKKRKKKEDFSTPKKFETSPTFLTKNKLLNAAWNVDESKSKMQDLVEELYKQQLDRAKEALHISDKVDSKKLEKKRAKIKKVEVEKCPDEVLNISKNIETQLNGTVGLEEKSEAQSLLDKLYEQEIQRVKGELSMSDKETFELTKKVKSKMIKLEKESSKKKTEDEFFKEKKRTKVELNGKNDSEQDVLQKLYTQEMNRVKEELRKLNNESAKLAKKFKTKTNKHETLKEGTCDSLYNKLLKEAKSSISLERDKLSSLPTPKESRKKRQKKDCEPLKLLTNSSEKKDFRKKKKNSKYKVEYCHETSGKFRNGSMYDVAATPEIINPDVSLFSDSEQSHASPVKREKGVNGMEVKSGTSVVQNMLDQFCSEEIKRLNNQSDREKKKKKIKQNSEILSENEESLYEKLLRNAKSLIDDKDHQRKKKK